VDRMTHSPLVRREAAIIGRIEFLAPLTLI